MDREAPAGRLITLLERLGERQREVLALLDRQHAAMVARDLQTLEGVTSGLVRMADQLQALERDRVTVTEQLVATLGVDDATIPLRDIAAFVEEPELANRLLGLRDELLAIQQQAVAARDRNQTLANNILSANDAALGALMNALREAGYGPGDTPRVLDRRA